MAKRIELKIGGMECPNCSMILERIEDKLDGVLWAEASYHKSQMIVEFDEKKLGEDLINKEVQKMGYTVLSIKYL
jgi:copper chaperone CopZ